MFDCVWKCIMISLPSTSTILYSSDLSMCFNTNVLTLTIRINVHANFMIIFSPLFANHFDHIVVYMDFQSVSHRSNNVSYPIINID